MSVTFLESFDNYLTNATAVLGKWQSIQDTIGALAIVPGAGRNGSAALRVNTNGSVALPVIEFLSRSFTATTRMIAGVAIKITQFDVANEWGIFSFMDGLTNQVTLTIDVHGFARLRRGAAYNGTVLATSAAPVVAATGVYYYLELDVTFSTTVGIYTLRSNGVQVFTGSNVNTAQSGNASANGINLGAIGPSAGNFPSPWNTIGFVDDMYVIDPTVGAHNTAFLGDTRVFAGFPIANGDTNNFTPQPNQANYLNVNQVEQDGDTTYNFDSNATDIDLYQHTATPASTGTIFAAQLCQVSRKDDAAARSTANILKSAGSFATGATQALSQSYAWFLDIVEVDPATTNPFTKAAIDLAQIGVKVAA